MSETTLLWMFWGSVVIFTLILILDVLTRRIDRRNRRMMIDSLQGLINITPDLQLIVEDLIRIEPEREEALSVARLELIHKREELQKLVTRLERKRWWK